MEPVRHSPRGRYEILEQIGRGSMGTVYRARDVRSGRDVALKTLNDGGASLDDRDLDRMRRLFLNEAGGGTLLSHPGIVAIYDLIDEPGSGEVFLAMELVNGHSLAEQLSRPDPVPFDFIVHVVSQVADVLDHVHAHGVVHRDIKPANILIDGWQVKVSDFGIADLYGDDLAEELGRDGTPSHMAPERVLGAGADHRADIWALGVVLYEMLTRRLPFEGESVADVVRAIACDEPTPAAEHGVRLLPGVQPILDRVLGKEPEERYQYAGEIAEDLRQVQEGQLTLSATLPALSIPEVVLSKAPPPSKPPPPEQSGGRLSDLLERWRLLAVALGAVTVVALGGLLVDEPPEPALQSTSEASDELQLQRLEYLALLEGARQLLEAGESDAAAELFARAEVLSPDAQRIRALRDDARRQAAEEVAEEIDLEVAGLVGIGEAELEAGRLEDAESTAERALELDPEHRGALKLADAVERRRLDLQALVERLEALRTQPPVEVVIATPEPEPEPEPLRIEEPIQPPTARPPSRFADLKVDFYSELPRGVITVYLEEAQILRRPFRFVEKKRFIRTKGISGGFDEQVRIDAGTSNFRIYLSLPGRETQVHRLSGVVPADTIRALRVRVDAAGELTVALN
jgi:tetratricopeptide (TPR) repeat protein